MKLAWRHYGFSNSGESRGYLTSGFHIYQGLKAREDVDLYHCDAVGRLEDGSAIHNKAVLHFCPPHLFRPFTAKTNILFSMWEADIIPPDILKAFEAADARIVPSSYCQAVLAAHGLDSHVAPLGVLDLVPSLDGSRRTIYTPGGQERRRFLFVGSGSLRKGWTVIPPAWRMAFEREVGNVQLYIKTIGATPEEQTIEEQYQGHVVIDRRDLSPREMVELYLSADVFIFPALAEAFGLPALEAMALGCLVIAPETGGLTEFVNPATAVIIEPTGTQDIEYGLKMRLRAPQAADLVPLLRAAYDGWGTPGLEAIRANGMRTARSMTWSKTAERVAEIVTSLQPKKVLAFHKKGA